MTHSGGSRVGHVLGRGGTRTHGDGDDVAASGVHGAAFVLVVGTAGAARLTAEVVLQPAVGLRFARLLLLVVVERPPREGVRSLRGVSRLGLEGTKASAAAEPLAKGVKILALPVLVEVLTHDMHPLAKLWVVHVLGGGLNLILVTLCTTTTTINDNTLTTPIRSLHALSCIQTKVKL